MFLIHLFVAYSQNELCMPLCGKLTNDGSFDVVRLDEIMTKHYLELFFFKIHLLIFIFIVKFRYHL